MFPAQANTALPFRVPARFLLTGTLALAAACTALALEPRLLLGSYLAPGVLAVAHLFTLGFATMILVGAMHQLVPVLLVSPLHSTRLGDYSYGLLLPGVLGVILGFALGYRVELLIPGGVLTLAGVLAFDYNLWRTARAATVWDRVAQGVTAAAGYLTLTVLMGLLMALGKAIPPVAGVLGYATPLHLGLGLVGAFFLAIAAAGHKLLAMFVLAHGLSQRRLAILLWLTHGALLLLAVDTFTPLDLVALWLPLLLAALVTFALDVLAILRKRLRPPDLPLRQFLLAPPFLLAAVPLGVAGHPEAAVFALLSGFITLAIAGMLVKILGFLTWQHRFAPLVGKEKVPMLRDLNFRPLVVASLWGLSLGALLVLLSQVWPAPTFAAVGAVALALGSWALLAHALWIVFGRHSRRGPSEANRARADAGGAVGAAGAGGAERAQGAATWRLMRSLPMGGWTWR